MKRIVKISIFCFLCILFAFSVGNTMNEGINSNGFSVPVTENGSIAETPYFLSEFFIQPAVSFSVITVKEIPSFSLLIVFFIAFFIGISPAERCQLQTQQTPHLSHKFFLMLYPFHGFW